MGMMRSKHDAEGSLCVPGGTGMQVLCLLERKKVFEGEGWS